MDLIILFDHHTAHNNRTLHLSINIVYISGRNTKKCN